MSRDPRASVAYRQARRRFIAKAEPRCTWALCPIPGRAIDTALSGRNAWGPVIDHIVPYAVDPSGFWNVNNWQLMHNRCNVQKGLRTDVAAMPRRSEEERSGLTTEEYAQWRARGLYPYASRQWYSADQYLGLPAPNPPPAWWPPS
jgi:hypothetical protein